jgi:hypothetical protein
LFVTKKFIGVKLNGVNRDQDYPASATRTGFRSRCVRTFALPGARRLPEWI